MDSLPVQLPTEDLQFYYPGAVVSANATQWWHDVKLATAVIALPVGRSAAYSSRPPAGRVLQLN